MKKLLTALLIYTSSATCGEIHFHYPDYKTSVIGSCDLDIEGNPINIQISIMGHIYHIDEISHSPNCPICTGEIY